MNQRAVPAGCRRAGLAGLALVSVALFGVAQSAPRGDDPKSPAEKFHPRLLEIAQTYEAFGRVDDEARWAPYYCRRPNPATARFSASRETTTHGQKLYSLFAKDRPAYLGRASYGFAPQGQAQARPWQPLIGGAPDSSWALL